MKNETKSNQALIDDPREKYAKPPYAPVQQDLPGTDQEMTPEADHGEKMYQGSGRLKDRVAVITGGDSGIGRAVAIAFAREGADVVISYLSDEHEGDDARETAKWVQDAGRKAVLIPGDIGSEPHCRSIIEKALDQFGKLDILVNNAAFQDTHDDIQEWTPEEWRHTFATNIDAMFFLSRAALPRMKPGGSIINTASVQAYKPSPSLLAYATTKGAIVTFTKALAQLAINNGVRVNAVAPGPVWTPLIPASFDEEKVKNFGKQTPLQRAAQPAELAPAFVFLAQSESSYVTGSVVDMTGGAMLP